MTDTAAPLSTPSPALVAAAQLSAAVAAAASAAAQSSPPVVSVSPKQSHRAAWFLVFALAAVALVAACYMALGWRQMPVHIFTIPLETRMPAAACVKVSREQIRNGTVEYSGGGVVNLRDVRNSLLYQMEKEEYSAACASFLHMPVHVCFCIINLAPERDSRPSYQDMYNLEYFSLSAMHRVLTTEHFPFCQSPVKRTRAKTCLARYLDKTGTLQVHRAERDDALYIQSMADVCDANALCQDTNEQVMMARIIDGESGIQSQRPAADTPRLGDGRGRA